MRPDRLIAPLATAVACALALSGCGNDARTDAQATGGASFVALGSLPGYASSDAAGVSADGGTVVGTSTSPAGFRQAVRWTVGQGAIGLGYVPGGTFSSASGVSSKGDVIVGDADGDLSSGLRAFRWTAATGLVAISALRGSTTCAAAGVSGDGEHIVGTCAGTGNEAFRWSESAGTIGLGRFGTGSNATSSATAISADGRVVGGAGHPVLVGAVLWDANNRPMILGNLEGDSGTVVTALSTNGAVAAGTSVDVTARTRAFRWTPETGAQPLGRTEAFDATLAAGIAGDGRRIVGSATTAEGEVAVLWDAGGGMSVLLDLLSPEGRTAARGWTLQRARGIAKDGRTIVGDGTNPAGVREAWAITLPD